MPECGEWSGGADRRGGFRDGWAVNDSIGNNCWRKTGVVGVRYGGLADGVVGLARSDVDGVMDICRAAQACAAAAGNAALVGDALRPTHRLVDQDLGASAHCAPVHCFASLICGLT